MDKRNYSIIIGSKAYFDKTIPSFSEEAEVQNFLELVKYNDKVGKSILYSKRYAKILIIKNSCYSGIVEEAHDYLEALIEDITTQDAKIYIHNPPSNLISYLESQRDRELINLEVYYEQYDIDRNIIEFTSKIKNISSRICGQNKAIDEVSKSLWYLSTVKRTKPYVIMLYGNSGLGKTELVHEISNAFFSGKCLEKHLSMFQDSFYHDYFFGNNHNRRSLAFDLLERESNLLFFDELDKCPKAFFSAFYTLFDNQYFHDATYSVDVSNIIIVITSNYQSKEEMIKELGEPLFFRVDKFVHFDDFDYNTIKKLVEKEIDDRKSEYQDRLNPTDIYENVSHLVFESGENARTIKYKVQSVIETLLYKDIQDKL